MMNLAEVTVAVDVLVNVSVEVRVELGRRRKERQTDSDQFPTQRRALPTPHHHRCIRSTTYINHWIQQQPMTTEYKTRYSYHKRT